jgi:hypothetical protein
MLIISDVTLICGDIFQECVLVQAISLFQRFVSVTIYIYEGIYIYIYIYTKVYIYQQLHF